MKVEKALLEDADSLTVLTIRSKSYWGYTKEQLEGWEEDLKISAHYISVNNVYKLILNDEIAGFYSFYSESTAKIRLDFFFVESKFIGNGYGKEMFCCFINQVKELNCKTVILDADPNDKGFYTKNGFKVVREIETSIKNRCFQVMELIVF